MRAPSVSIVLALIASIVITASITPRPASADWPTLGRAVSTAVKNQERPKVASDGAGGAIIVWQDARSKQVNIFARRVLASGDLDPQWPVDGRPLLGDSTALDDADGGQQFPVIVPDGAGGAIVAWQGGRSLESGLDIFAQHVLASGVVDPAWPANGRALCTVRGQQDIPTIVSDGAGGAIVTWMDGRSGVTDVDIFAQHVLASGAVDPNWPANGVALSTAPAPQAFPNITTDGSGGAIVTWYDFRSSDTSIDIYAQHVTGSGSVDPAWPANGRALCLAPGAQVDPTIVSDGAHGAIVTWEDPRDGTSHIYAQRVLGSGAIAAGWPVDGRAVCTAPVLQDHPIITSDGASGAIVTWLDARNGQNHNPFAQHVLASGAIDAAWPDNGRALSLSSGEELAASIVPDGAGGAIVAWEEDFFILAQHVQASGLLDPTFPVNGRFVRFILTFQIQPDLTTSGAGNAIVAWSDAAGNADFDIYAMIVVTGETLAVDPGTPAPGITFAGPSPNPARGPVTLSFALPREAAVQLVIYDAAGRRVRKLMSGTQPAGRHEVAWDQKDDGGRPVSAGIRFARLEVEGHALTEKVVTTR
jgi:hypothetical protein